MGHKMHVPNGEYDRQSTLERASEENLERTRESESLRLAFLLHESGAFTP